MRKQKGFTLAEVLITLAIIGIIAAVNIPTLLNSMDESKYTTQYKKVFAEISQLVLKVRSDNSGLLGVFTSTTDVLNTLENNMNVIKKCNTGDHLGGNCWASTMTYGSSKDASMSSATTGGVLLSNGVAIGFNQVPSSTCKATAYTVSLTETETGTKNHCVSMLIDVNGLKGPNTAGKDIYGLAILEDRVVPYGPTLAVNFDEDKTYEDLSKSSTVLYGN